MNLRIDFSALDPSSNNLEAHMHQSVTVIDGWAWPHTETFLAILERAWEVDPRVHELEQTQRR